MPEVLTKVSAVHWRINCMCDTRCPYCYGVEELHEVQPETCLPVLDKMIDHGVGTFVLTGGEPLLSKRLDRVIRHLAGRNVKVVLYTSCQYWDFHDEVLTECVDTVCLPIEGASEKTHDSIRGVNSLRAVQAVLDRYATPGGRRPFKVRVGTAVGRHNLSELEAILYFLDNYELESWTLYKYPRYTDREVLKKFKKEQMAVSVAEYEAAAARVMKVPDHKTEILLSSDNERKNDYIMLNPELEVVVPTREESGSVTDRILCSAEETDMSRIEVLWSDSVDWDRYLGSLRVSL